METRKVQVTGGSTFTVSIPKGWATENGIEAGNRVEFHPEGDSLLLSPRATEDTVEGSVEITDLEGPELTRTVFTLYVSGFDVINLEATRVTPDQRRTVRDATQGLVGLEVIEETSDRVVLQDLLDSSELSIHNAITRMRLVAVTMLDDAVTAITDDDTDLATDVIERDDDVDRLWFMISRVFRSALRNPSTAADIGLPRETCFDYHSSARQLERIADHASKIGRLTLELDDVPEDVADALAELHDEASAIVEMAMDALLEDDGTEATELANEARERVRNIDRYTRKVDDRIREMDAQRAQNLSLIVDSLSRSADYGGNIAETALQKAAPRPE
ncbi:MULTISPECIES: phosphate uptake regulator PhoU [Halorussus]|uniref:phosphate uptake regulator PhoU n=1 Tax=Halorussus TaxID=1070314 RepID=UPI00209FD04C|nr:phosphate uptake regulator PhoU [Halorussus vallis]USZ76959.1 phosphate uptake regulator PhoU [Halorussus vallis]